jgi:holo-[acyl-carrier protein] synthase
VIYGVGTDLVEIGRIENALARFGERFARRILSESEFNRFKNHRLPAAYLAKRFAAKEAFVKALGTGIHAPANWHGVWVKNLPSGQPVLEFSKQLQALMKRKKILQAHVSLSDERGVAFATVILECER